MVYAAVATVLQILEQLLCPRREEHRIFYDPCQLESLLEKLQFFRGFLDNSPPRRSSALNYLERKIRDTAHELQDLIESYISKHFLPGNDEQRRIKCEIFRQKLELIMRDVDAIEKKALGLMNLWADVRKSHREQPPPARLLKTLSRRIRFPDENTAVVGVHDVAEKLKNKLTGHRPNREIITIAGMGGAGKTTLARSLYNDEYIEFYFDARAWITVSQAYNEREVLLGILQSMRKLTDEVHGESNEHLSVFLYKSLKGRRYLIVMDDVWSREAVDFARRLFPDDRNKSRIVITTRLAAVCEYASLDPHYRHQMGLLSGEDSWKLLCTRVFIDAHCPVELEEAGRKIAESCGGLPLSVVVVSGFLKQVEMTKTAWEEVAGKTSKSVIANDLRCSELLSLSYHQLPHHLKPCFLYMGAFLEGAEIPVSKLVKLWVAEGFLKLDSFKSPEDVAVECLNELISRNLVLAGQIRIDGTIKTCSIHDALRELCLEIAKQDQFLYAIMHPNQGDMCKPRRLSIQGSFSSLSFGTIAGREALAVVRTLLFSSSNELPEIHGLSAPWELLRVLDLGMMPLYRFSVGQSLSNLRYLSIKKLIPSSLPDHLWYLQTCIVCPEYAYCCVKGTRVLWRRMPNLRHLQVPICDMALPRDEDLVLENLQTLRYIRGSTCSSKFFSHTPNLRKLGIRVEASDCESENEHFSLGNFSNLPKLENLRCMVYSGLNIFIPESCILPQTLKKVTLNSTRIPWESMSIFGTLPKLQVLKLMNNAFQGEHWSTKEDEFQQLKYLMIEEADLQFWEIEAEHFPRLEHVALWGCSKLEGIPLEIGEIETLRMIQLDDASSSAITSVRKIQEVQQSYGNELQAVQIFYNWEERRKLLKAHQSFWNAEQSHWNEMQSYWNKKQSHANKLQNYVNEKQSYVNQLQSNGNEPQSYVNELQSLVDELQSLVDELQSYGDEPQSYVNELQCHANELYYGNELLSNGNELLSNGSELLSNGNELLSNGNELLSNGNELLSNGNELLSNGNELLSNGNELLRRR